MGDIGGVGVAVAGVVGVAAAVITAGTAGGEENDKDGDAPPQTSSLNNMPNSSIGPTIISPSPSPPPPPTPSIPPFPIPFPRTFLYARLIEGTGAGNISANPSLKNESTIRLGIWTAPCAHKSCT